MVDKLQQLFFKEGITNNPSDALCSDNCLEESVGMVFDGGEHRVVQDPEMFIDTINTGSLTITDPTIIFVHRKGGKDRYIIRYKTNYDTNIAWGTKAENSTTLVIQDFLHTEDTPNTPMTFTEDVQITSIGNILILSDGSGLYYFLWKESEGALSYKYLGDNIPRPEVSFKLSQNKYVLGHFVFYEQLDEAQKVTLNSGTIYESGTELILNPEAQEYYNDVVLGLFAKLRKKLAQRKLFYGHFCVRVALELYDGSFYHISNPIFMANNLTGRVDAAVKLGDDGGFVLSLRGLSLQYKFGQDYREWSDIVKNVVVFMTNEWGYCNTTVDAICSRSSSGDTYYQMFNREIHEYHPYRYWVEGYNYTLVNVIESLPKREIENIITSGVYYKLFEIGLSGDNTFQRASDKIETGVLENITSQQQLEYDDYFSHCQFKAKNIFTYNSRLNLANVSRGFFEGFDNFMPFDDITEGVGPGQRDTYDIENLHTYTFYVTIKTNDGDRVVVHTKETSQKQGIYFYYPDVRAKHVVIIRDGLQILNEDLKTHPALNGAYYFSGISEDMEEPSTASGTIPTPSQEDFEDLNGTIITSEVNNPYVFNATGYNEVNAGEVLGISTITQALSEGQFGSFPLLAFTDTGIWALQVNSDGTYSSIHPISREVCNNPKSITQTDGAVFFTSEKGLMCVVGNQVTCVSGQLSGHERTFDGEISMGHFVEFLRTSFMAYDYRDSLLWIFDGKTRNNVFGKSTCYVYSIKSGAFGKYTFTGNNGSQVITNVINKYPDYLLQDNSNKIVSLLERKNINEDTTKYTGLMITRPMKLENALALKSIMQIRHISDLEGSMTLRIFASNNFTNWVELQSLRGTPWKYYRFRFDFTNMKATDRFSGTVVVTQERRTDKLR